MRRLVLLIAFVGTASCSDDGFQLGSGAPDTDYNVTEVGSGDSGNPDEDASLPDTNEDDSDPVDSSVIDSGVSDSSKDTAPKDTGTGPIDTGFDTGRADTGSFDTGTFDTGTFDSSSPDTGTWDTGTFDSGTFDSGTWDSGSFDTGRDTSTGDIGPACPMPPSTKVWSVDDLTCAELDTKYRAAVQESRRCNCDADCSQEVAKDFCWCTTAVNPGNDAYTFLAVAADRYSKLGCTTACPLGLCLPAVKGRCLTTSTGKFCSDGSSVSTP